ncbi:VOC family protein [Nocardia sp. NPDC051030]|uniref:VOC family protein n=1 Tax=Nocardia sp. NPDC051030 TaxID=3155162 RepID=UPI00343FC60E
MNLTVADPAASSEFFGTHLGFRELVATDDFIYLGRDDATTEIMLERTDLERPPPPVLRPSGVTVSFTVTGIDDEHERLRREGANITGPLVRLPGGEWRMLLTDPNGVVVQLVEWTPPAGA